jgi:hypothetical protein
MAVHGEPEPIDPLDEEIERALADPKIRESLLDFLRRDKSGQLAEGIPTEEVRRRLGTPPAELDDDLATG